MPFSQVPAGAQQILGLAWLWCCGRLCCCIHMLQLYIYMLNTYRRNEQRTSEDFLTNNIPLTLFLTFACERELETEQNCNILTPTLMAIGFVSFSFSRASQPEAQRLTLLGAGFLYCFLSPNSMGGPEGPFCWVVAVSTTSCH